MREQRSVFPTENTNEKDGLSKDSGGQSFSSPFFVVKFLMHRLKSSGYNVPPKMRKGKEFYIYYILKNCILQKFLFSFLFSSFFTEIDNFRRN